MLLETGQVGLFNMNVKLIANRLPKTIPTTTRIIKITLPQRPNE